MASTSVPKTKLKFKEDTGVDPKDVPHGMVGLLQVREYKGPDKERRGEREYYFRKDTVIEVADFVGWGAAWAVTE